MKVLIALGLFVILSAAAPALAQDAAQSPDLLAPDPKISVVPQLNVEEIGPGAEDDIFALMKDYPPDVQESILKDGDTAFDYCASNSVMSTLYDCSCFAEKIVAVRIKEGPDVFLQSLFMTTDIRKCVFEPGVAGYVIERCNRSLMFTSTTTPKIDESCRCAARTMVRDFKRSGSNDMVTIDRMFNEVVDACYNQLPGAMLTGTGTTP